MPGNYWLIVESRHNWEADLAKDFRSYGFPQRAEGTVRKIAKGDFLVAYISKASAFADIREVQSSEAVKVDGMDEYASAEIDQQFSVKVETRPVVVLEPESWVSVKRLLDELVLTKGKKSWGWMFRTSLRKLDADDGKRIADAIRAAKSPASSLRVRKT